MAGAVALAVLDTIQSQRLQDHAAAVGAVLRAGFERLHARFRGLIGSVRGVGLMQGLEILRPGFSDADPMARREPWPEAASAIVYAMRARRILLSCDGMSQNVIKLVRRRLRRGGATWGVLLPSPCTLLFPSSLASALLQKPPMVFTAADATRVLRELEEVMHGLDTRSLLAASLPPTFVHAARPLPLPAAAFHTEAAIGSSSRPDGILRTFTFRPSAAGAHDGSSSGGSGAAAAAGGAVVLRTPVPAFSPPAAASSASRTGGEKRRREDSSSGSGGSGSLADVITLLDAFRGDVASLAGRVAGVEEAVLLGASRRL